MKFAKLIAWIGVLAMASALVYGFTNGDFVLDGSRLLSNPWGIVSMVDLYTGFILFSLWIVYREDKLGVKIFWVVLMMVLGFFTGAVYTLLALYSSQGDWDRFWKGIRAT